MEPKTLQQLDRRIPDWNLQELHPRACPICEVEGATRYIRPDKLQVAYCSMCNLHYVSPAPGEAELTRFYDSYDLTHRNLPRISGSALRQQYEKMNPNTDYRFQTITSLVNPAGKSVLDVGFGRAFFLYFLQKMGSKVTGIELDTQAINYARDHLGLNDVRQLNVLDLKSDEKFDIILMMDLIEHVLDPRAYLEKLAELLNPGGIMVIFTPNGGAISKQEQPVQLRVDLEHLQYFSSLSCNRIARECALDILYLETSGYPYLSGIIDEPQLSLPARVKRRIARFPGVEAGYALWKRAFAPDQPRQGNYHLFCIFGKPISKLRA